MQVYVDSASRPGYPTTFGSDTALVFRNMYFNYKGFGGGRTNVKAGHFEVPFGIEQHVTTNGELRGFMSRVNLGLKSDWGLSLNGTTSGINYELAWMRGSGNRWESRGSPGALSGRIATGRPGGFGFGMSFFDGDVFSLATPDQPVARTRFGADVQFAWRAVELLGEWSAGSEAGVDVSNTMVEVSMNSPGLDWMFYLQARESVREAGGGDDHAVGISAGVKFEPTNNWSLSVDVSRDLGTIAPVPRGHRVRAQLRYRLQ